MKKIAIVKLTLVVILMFSPPLLSKSHAGIIGDLLGGVLGSGDGGAGIGGAMPPVDASLSVLIVAGIGFSVTAYQDKARKKKKDIADK